MKDAQYWIEHLDLQGHPEGGYFREIYRSSETIEKGCLPPRYESPRAMGTSIYYLLKEQDVSLLHRLKSDEIWHFYTGSPVQLHCFDKKNGYSVHTLGGNPDNNCQFQIIIPQNTWFGAEIKESSSFSLVGCTVSPGFDFKDFELAPRQDLLKQYPRHKKIIEKLTRHNTIET